MRYLRFASSQKFIRKYNLEFVNDIMHSKIMIELLSVCL